MNRWPTCISWKLHLKLFRFYPNICECNTAKLDRYRLELGMFGDFQQNGFPDKASALDWQKANGRYLLVYGSQTVAILA